MYFYMKYLELRVDWNVTTTGMLIGSVFYGSHLSSPAMMQKVKRVIQGTENNPR